MRVGFFRIHESTIALWPGLRCCAFVVVPTASTQGDIMSAYQLLVFVHVAAATALLAGSVIGSPAVRRAVRGAATTRDLRAFLTIGRPLAVLEPVAAVVVLASGIYLTSVIRFWALGWVQVAVAFWVVNAALAGTLVKPAIERIAREAHATTGQVIGERLDALRWSDRWSYGGDLVGATDVAMLFLMTVKPGHVGSLAAVAAAWAVVLGARLLRRRSRPAAAAPAPPAPFVPAGGS
jgi:hypothetical protein